MPNVWFNSFNVHKMLELIYSIVLFLCFGSFDYRKQITGAERLLCFYTNCDNNVKSRLQSKIENLICLDRILVCLANKRPLRQTVTYLSRKKATVTIYI